MSWSEWKLVLGFQTWPSASDVSWLASFYEPSELRKAGSAFFTVGRVARLFDSAVVQSMPAISKHNFFRSTSCLPDVALVKPLLLEETNHFRTSCLQNCSSLRSKEELKQVKLPRQIKMWKKPYPPVCLSFLETTIFCCDFKPRSTVNAFIFHRFPLLLKRLPFNKWLILKSHFESHKYKRTVWRFMEML